MPDKEPRGRTQPSRRLAGGVALRSLFALSTGIAGFAGPAEAESNYTLDQRFGSIEFAVDNAGLFTAEGQFKRFRSDLTIDEAHPERTRIAVDVDAGSVDMFWPQGVTMLRSPDYFDVAKFPDVRFKSTKVVALTADHYVIQGDLEIRSIQQPFVLDARMVDRHMDPAGKMEIADFVVSGTLKRSQFGMLADQGFVSDSVKLKITAHILLNPADRAN